MDRPPVVTSKILFSPRIRRLAVIVLPVLVILFLVFACGFKRSQIDKAKALLNEFKTAKALDELLIAKKLNPHSNQELDFLILYAYVKSKQYSNAMDTLKKLESFPRAYAEQFKNMIDILNTDNQSQLLLEAVKRSDSLKLGEEFFINLSKKRDSIDSELKVLETGLSYLKKQKSKTADIENYLLNRYLEIANIYSGSDQYSTAISYLLQAQQLSIFEGSPFKDDIYLNLALAYKGVGEHEKAWDYIKKSADLGNEVAKHQLLNLNQKYQN
jgi:hypothetical protein